VQPAASDAELADIMFDEDLPPLSDGALAKRSFHVKQDLSPAGRGVSRAIENNNLIAENLLDLVEILCSDGIIVRAEWQPSIDAIREMLKDNGST